jgi:hypothetical protein
LRYAPEGVGLPLASTYQIAAHVFGQGADDDASRAYIHDDGEIEPFFTLGHEGAERGGTASRGLSQVGAKRSKCLLHRLRGVDLARA